MPSFAGSLREDPEGEVSTTETETEESEHTHTPSPPPSQQRCHGDDVEEAAGEFVLVARSPDNSPPAVLEPEPDQSFPEISSLLHSVEEGREPEGFTLSQRELSESAVAALHAHYETEKSPDSGRVAEIAAAVGGSVRGVQLWFETKRAIESVGGGDACGVGGAASDPHADMLLAAVTASPSKGTPSYTRTPTGGQRSGAADGSNKGTLKGTTTSSDAEDTGDKGGGGGTCCARPVHSPSAVARVTQHK